MGHRTRRLLLPLDLVKVESIAYRQALLVKARLPPSSLKQCRILPGILLKWGDKALHIPSPSFRTLEINSLIWNRTTYHLLSNTKVAIGSRFSTHAFDESWMLIWCTTSPTRAWSAV